MTNCLPEHAGEVLAIFDAADNHDGLFWRAGGDEPIRFYAKCSDTFWWATADAEVITPEDVPVLRQCLDDLRLHDEPYLLGELFAARKRGMRPMRLWLGIHPASSDRKPWKSLDLFLACGPERNSKDEG